MTLTITQGELERGYELQFANHSYKVFLATTGSRTPNTAIETWEANEISGSGYVALTGPVPSGTWDTAAVSDKGSVSIQFGPFTSNVTFDALVVKIFPTPYSVTNAELTSNIATLRFASSPGFAVNDAITVSGMTSPFAGLNGDAIVTAVTSTPNHTVSFTRLGSNISSASVSNGTVAIKSPPRTVPYMTKLYASPIVVATGQSKPYVITFQEKQC